MNTAWATWRALITADLRLYFSNRRAIWVNVLAPIFIAAFMGYLFAPKQAGEAASAVAIAVVDDDASALSQAVVAGLKTEPMLAITPMAREAAREQVQKGKLSVAVVIPQGFGEAAPLALFGAGPRPQIALLHDPAQATALAMVRGLLAQQVMQQASRQMMAINGATQQTLRAAIIDAPAAERGALTRLLDSIDALQRVLPTPASGASAPSAAAASGGMQLPFEASEQAVTSASGTVYNGYAHAFAGMTVQFILFMGIDLGVAVLLAQRMGLWSRLRAAPISRSALLGSRILAIALIALITMLPIYAAAMAVFGVRIEGSVLGFVGVAAAFALFTGSFGLLIAALGRSPEAARGIAILVTLILVMLGGAWIPSFIFPAWMQQFTLATPTRWAIDGLEAMTWRGLPLSDALAPITVLLGFALVLGVLAVKLFRWERA